MNNLMIFEVLRLIHKTLFDSTILDHCIIIKFSLAES